MKDNILGIILLSLLVVGSSDLIAAEYTPEQLAYAEEVALVYTCSSVYMRHDNPERGIKLAQYGDDMSESAGFDFADQMKLRAQANEVAARTDGGLPPETAQMCAQVYLIVSLK